MDLIISLICLAFIKTTFAYDKTKFVEAFIREATDDDIILGYNEDANLNFTERVNKYGYTSEEHSVTTEDGYKLTIFRITDSKKCKEEKKKVPVMLCHGLAVNGMSWIEPGPGVGLAYILADKGYDVWVVNTRGTKYSREHSKLKPSDQEFWRYSSDDKALKDLPPMIDYILNKAGSSKLNFVGHSEGGGYFFALASTKTDYQKKIGVAITLAPVTWTYGSKSIYLKVIAKNYKSIFNIAHKYIKDNKMVDEHLPDNVLTMKCPLKLEAGTLCRLMYKIMQDGDRHPIDENVISSLFKNFPEPVTKKNMIRYTQHINKKVYQMMDLGKDLNVKTYGSESPPKYDVSCINTPVAIMYAKKDQLSSYENLCLLKNQTRNIVDFYQLKDVNADHYDFVLSKDTPTLIAPKVCEYLEQFDN